MPTVVSDVQQVRIDLITNFLVSSNVSANFYQMIDVTCTLQDPHAGQTLGLEARDRTINSIPQTPRAHGTHRHESQKNLNALDTTPSILQALVSNPNIWIRATRGCRSPASLSRFARHENRAFTPYCSTTMQ